MSLIEKIHSCKSEDELLKLWKEYDNKCPNSSDFMEDGLLRNGCESNWNEYNPCRVLFLLKECCEPGGDVRDWLNPNNPANREFGTIDRNGKKKRNIFYPLACILFGIKYWYDHDYKTCSFEYAIQNVGHIHTEIPFAYVEAKKLPGGATANNNEIKQYVREHKDFLQKEIDLLNPTIIICCDNGVCRLEKTVRELTEGKTVSIVTAYHPCARMSVEKMYFRVMNSLNPFNKYDEVKNILNTSFKSSIIQLAKELGLECKYTPGNWCKQYEGQFSFYHEEWNDFCISFEFIGDNLTGFMSGVKYKNESTFGKNEEKKKYIAKKLGGTASQWYASYKLFNPRDWNNAEAFEKLINGEMIFLIKEKLDSLLKELETIDL